MIHWVKSTFLYIILKEFWLIYIIQNNGIMPNKICKIYKKILPLPLFSFEHHRVCGSVQKSSSPTDSETLRETAEVFLFPHPLVLMVGANAAWPFVLLWLAFSCLYTECVFTLLFASCLREYYTTTAIVFSILEIMPFLYVDLIIRCCSRLFHIFVLWRHSGL